MSANRTAMLTASLTAAANLAYAEGCGAVRAGFTLYVNVNGTCYVAPTGALEQGYVGLSKVPLSGYASAAALLTALQAAMVDPQPSSGPY